MTHDQAISRVLAAFPTPSDGGQLANDMVFAQRLLAALQALDVVKLGEAEAKQQEKQQPAAEGKKANDGDISRRQR